MKKVVALVLVLFTLSGMAQDRRKNQSDRKGGPDMMKQMTPNDIADLKTKRLTLRLDLNEKQQKEVHSLILNQAKSNEILRQERRSVNAENKGKPSKDEFVKMENHRLDQQIKIKQAMKSILTADQYVKFEQIKPRSRNKQGRRSGENQEKR